MDLSKDLAGRVFCQYQTFLHEAVMEVMFNPIYASVPLLFPVKTLENHTCVGVPF